MADDTAAKLAAGRKMLKDFQKRKTGEKVHCEVKQVDHVHTNNGQSGENIDVYNKMIHQEAYHNYQDLSNQIEMFPSNSIQQPSENINQHSSYFQTSHNNNLAPSTATASVFFDQITPQNTNSVQSDNNIFNGNAPEIPLADVLFSNQTLQRESNINVQPNPVHRAQSIHDNCTPPDTHAAYNKEVIESGGEEDINDMRSIVKNSKLQQQLQFHMKTVEFLVSEKTELTSKINDLERVILEMKTHNDDISGRLNTSRHRASHMEIEFSNLKQKNHETESRLTQVMQDLTRYQATELSLRNAKKELEEELQETKSLMSTKVQENKELQQNIEEMKFHISTSELLFQQLAQGNYGGSNVDHVIRDQFGNMEQQVKYLTEQLAEAEHEKNQSNLQYQQYVQQINNQIESMAEKHEELLLENENLSNRESNLLSQMGALEKQLQTLQTHNKINLQLSQSASQIEDPQLKENLQRLEKDQSELKADLQTKDKNLQAALAELSESRYQIEELTNSLRLMQSDRPDAAKLNAANESDRLAAQKATTQNAKMKLDLEHLEEAFGQMTNSKLELAELLQAEKNLSKMLSLKLAENEENFKEVRSKLLAKDEEMIRLQASSSNLQKEVLKNAQIADRLSHYEAQGQSSDVLQNELESAKNRLSVISTENAKLKRMLEKIKQKPEDVEVTEDVEVPDDVEESNEAISLEQDNQLCANIPNTEAMEKLQGRFTKLMKEVADLSDEKQRLEHLVLQLQGETETICEYITLYQKQRGILKQRETEKDVQLNLLTQERQHMKEQLDQLNGLIQQLVHKNNQAPDQETHHLNNTNNEENKDNLQTADRIMDLLSEIKTSHLIEPGNNCAGLGTFHSCAWCSGKLIDV